MFIVNPKAIHLFKKDMQYHECLDVWDKNGFGRIPFGEYCLMMGIVNFSESSGVPVDVVAASLSRYSVPFAPVVIPEESRGLGDTIAKITHATGFNKLAEMYTKITGKPCGCQSRQEALNLLLPYGIKEE